MKPGDFMYLKRATVYHQCRVLSLHEFQSSAKVAYYADGDPVICRQDELLTTEQYEALLEKRRKQAYEDSRKIELADVVGHWREGRRTGKEISAVAGGTAGGWTRKIKSALKLGIIT